MAPERKFFGEKQFRSKRLPTALWDECKEDILKWREEGGMALVISEMQRVHALSLTASQFEHRFRVWAKAAAPRNEQEKESETGPGILPVEVQVDCGQPSASPNTIAYETDQVPAVPAQIPFIGGHNSLQVDYSSTLLKPLEISYRPKRRAASINELFPENRKRAKVFDADHKPKRAVATLDELFPERTKRTEDIDAEQLNAPVDSISPAPPPSAPFYLLTESYFKEPDETFLANRDSLDQPNVQQSQFEEIFSAVNDSSDQSSTELAESEKSTSVSADSSTRSSAELAVSEDKISRRSHILFGLFVKRKPVRESEENIPTTSHPPDEPHVEADVSELKSSNRPRKLFGSRIKQWSSIPHVNIAQWVKVAISKHSHVRDGQGPVIKTSNRWHPQSSMAGKLPIGSQNLITDRAGTEPLFRMNLSQLVGSYSEQEMLLIRKTAQALQSFSLLEDAFYLNIVVLKRFWLHSINDSDLEEHSAMIACVRSAVEQSHLITIRELLEERLLETEGMENLKWKLVKLVLMNALLAEVCQRQGDLPSSGYYMEQATLLFSDSSMPLTSYTDVRLDYLTSLYLCYCYDSFCFPGAYQYFDWAKWLRDTKETPERFRATSLYLLDLCLFGKLSENMSWVKRSQGTREIRRRLHWCSSQLVATDSLPSLAERFCEDPVSQIDAEYRAVQWLLWINWTESQVSPFPVSRAELDDVFGLSMTEYIAVLSGMIVNYRPEGSSLSIPGWITISTEKLRQSDLLTRAYIYTLSLCGLPDETLVTLFLTHLLEQSYFTRSANSLPESAWKALKAHALDALCISLDNSSLSETADWCHSSQSFAYLVNNDVVALTKKMPTLLGSSVVPSEFSSLLRSAERINRHGSTAQSKFSDALMRAGSYVSRQPTSTADWVDRMTEMDALSRSMSVVSLDR